MNDSEWIWPCDNKSTLWLLIIYYRRCTIDLSTLLLRQLANRRSLVTPHSYSLHSKLSSCVGAWWLCIARVSSQPIRDRNVYKIVSIGVYRWFIQPERGIALAIRRQPMCISMLIWDRIDRNMVQYGVDRRRLRRHRAPVDRKHCRNVAFAPESVIWIKVSGRYANLHIFWKQ